MDFVELCLSLWVETGRCRMNHVREFFRPDHAQTAQSSGIAPSDALRRWHLFALNAQTRRAVNQRPGQPNRLCGELYVDFVLT